MQIDWWTLALQTINVLVLVWILARFLFRPLREIVVRRQAKADALLTEASREAESRRKREAAEGRAPTWTPKGDDWRRAREEAAKRSRACSPRRARMSRRLRAAAEAAPARERAAMEGALIARIERLAVEIRGVSSAASRPSRPRSFRRGSLHWIRWAAAADPRAFAAADGGRTDRGGDRGAFVGRGRERLREKVEECREPALCSPSARILA